MCVQDIMFLCVCNMQEDAWFVAVCETVIVGSLEKMSIYLGTLMNLHFLIVTLVPSPITKQLAGNIPF
jgi:hypothetical protein